MSVKNRVDLPHATTRSAIDEVYREPPHRRRHGLHLVTCLTPQNPSSIEPSTRRVKFQNLSEADHSGGEYQPRTLIWSSNGEAKKGELTELCEIYPLKNVLASDRRLEVAGGGGRRDEWSRRGARSTERHRMPHYLSDSERNTAMQSFHWTRLPFAYGYSSASNCPCNLTTDDALSPRGLSFPFTGMFGLLEDEHVPAN